MKSPSKLLPNWAVVAIALLAGIMLYQCQNQPQNTRGTHVKFSLEFYIK